MQQLDRRQPRTRQRSHKLRLPRGSISVRTHRSLDGIKQDWGEIIANDELTLGEQYYPCTIIKFKVVDGELTSENATVYGRKIPLLDIRQKLLRNTSSICTYTPMINLLLSQMKNSYTSLKRRIQIPEDKSQQNLRQVVWSRIHTYYCHLAWSCQSPRSGVCSCNSQAPVRSSCVQGE